MRYVIATLPPPFSPRAQLKICMTNIYYFTLISIINYPHPSPRRTFAEVVVGVVVAPPAAAAATEQQ